MLSGGVNAVGLALICTCGAALTRKSRIALALRIMRGSRLTVSFGVRADIGGCGGRWRWFFGACLRGVLACWLAPPTLRVLVLSRLHMHGGLYEP